MVLIDKIEFMDYNLLMKQKVKISISSILLAVSIVIWLYLLWPVSIDGFTNRDLREKLQMFKQQSDTIIIHHIAPLEGPDIKLTGEDVKEFFSLLKLKLPRKGSYCKCLGDLQFSFQKSGEELASISYHNGISVRGILPIRSDIDIVPEYRYKLRTFLKKHHVNLYQ